MTAHQVDNKREIRFTQLSLIATLLFLAGLFHFLGERAENSWLAGDTAALIETAVFSAAMAYIAYGNLLYHICLSGYYKRREQHKPVPRDLLESAYLRKAPALSILIPSYKEERSVNWQTMISAALAEYPEKNIVLLIDDPYKARALEDIIKLEDTRTIPGQLQALFDAQGTHYRAELAAFRSRLSARRIAQETELERLAASYERVASWVEGLAVDFMGNRSYESLSHADRFFIDAILKAPAREHRKTAAVLRLKQAVSEDYLHTQYARLAGLFTVRFSSFERKKYSNLSHEANKAMNLNSYIELIGKSWREVETGDGLHLCECPPGQADFTIPDADYVDTIDADSMMLSDYALRLIHLMEQPENARLAVIQSPCSSFPGCPGGVERAAGACIDVQFLTHQGYTHWGASFWVGANAMLRRKALKDIREVRIENGHEVAIYIQDRTVIEDTESTIDLVSKGWELYNYPERMTFSATPPDFGSLLIQRRRWSNGGLIILPKLLRYAANAPKNLALCREMFMRFNYLASTSIGCFIALMFMLYPFGDVFSTPWLPLSTIPFFITYARDLKNAGYKYSDVFRICALNLMLFPVVTGGVFKSLQQIVTGEKIPFGRTPKVTGRTAAPALYCLAELLLPAIFLGISGRDMLLGHWSQASFALVNGGFFLYALIHFIGLKAATDDVLAGLRTRLRKAFHHAEIIPISTAQNLSGPLSAVSKRA